MSETLDIAVVGAGPCGIAVGAAAAEGGLDAVLFDRGCVTNSIVAYPYYMTFFSTSRNLEIGGVPFSTAEPKPTRREALVYYRRVVEHHDMRVHQYEEVTSVEGVAGDFRLRTRLVQTGEEKSWRAKAVVVATGGFHEPNWLNVSGEDLPKVRHYYQEPYPYYDQDVVVVGGGSSAVEAALELFRNGARVTLVHFAEWIDSGVKPWMVPDITNRVQNGELPAYWQHRIVDVLPRSVRLRHEVTGEETEIQNDWVLAMTGWRSDSHLLRELGVHVDPTTAIPRHDPVTMETDVPGVYIAGVLAAGSDANKIFIENGKEHGKLIVQALR